MSDTRRRFSMDESRIDPTLKNRIFSADGEEVLGYWNGESIQDLVAELDRIEERDDANYNSLPHHQNIPEDLLNQVEKDYPIWACDQKGGCLVGDGMTLTETVEQIRAHYNDQYGSIENFKEKLRADRQKFLESLEGPS